MKTFLEDLLEQGSTPSLPEDMDMLVQGIGRMKVGQAHSKVVSMLVDMSRRAQSGDVDWSEIKHMLTNSALSTYVNSLAALQNPGNK